MNDFSQHWYIPWRVARSKYKHQFVEKELKWIVADNECMLPFLYFRTQLKQVDEISPHCCKRNANPDISPLPDRLYLIQKSGMQATIALGTPVTAVSVNEEERAREKFSPALGGTEERKEKKHNKVKLSLPYFPWRRPADVPGFTPEMENIAIRRIID